MLPSLWLRLTSSGPKPSDERALARYFRDEGLHVELASQLAQSHELRAASPTGLERTLYAAHSYFLA
jgi:hypothetical protein